MEAIEAIALMLGAAWASGINLYATIVVLGWMGSTGQVDLPPALEVLQDPTVMFAAGLMYCVEFFADKVPGVDSGWDTIHTFIRIPAGAMMAAGAAEGLEIGQAAELTALILGGALSATSHATKTSGRLLINTSPEPVTNWTASITEDVAVVGGLWAALNHPWWFLAALVVFLLIVAWLLPKIWRTLKRVFRAVGRWFSGKRDPGETVSEEFQHRRRDVLGELYHDAGSDKSTP